MASTDQMLQVLNDIRNQLYQLNTVAKNTSKPQKTDEERSASKAQKALEKELEKETKTRDNLSKSIKDVTKKFDSLESSVVKFDESVKKSGSNIGSHIVSEFKNKFIPGYKTVSDSLKNFENKINETANSQNEYTKGVSSETAKFIKTNFNNIATVQRSINAYKDYINVIGKVSNDHRQLSKDEKIALNKSLLELEGSYKKSGIKVDSLNSDILKKLQKGMSLTDDQLKQLRESITLTNKDFTAIHNVAKSGFEAGTAHNENMAKASSNALDSLLENLKVAGTALGTETYKNAVAQLKFGQKESNYIGAGQLGLSPRELSEFISENRLLLRSMSTNGKALQPTQPNGKINDLQNQVGHLYGLTGLDAVKFIGKSANEIVAMGGDVSTVNKQMTSLYQTMQATNMTFGELDGMLADLSKSPAFLSLIQATGYDNQAEQIDLMTKMLVKQGYQATYLKDLLELNKQHEYQGVEEAVKGMVGLQLYGNQVNNTLGRNAISGEDIALLKEFRGRGGAQGFMEAFQQGNLSKGLTVNGKSVYDYKPEELNTIIGEKQLKVNQAGLEARIKNSGASSIVGGQAKNQLLNTFSGYVGGEYGPGALDQAKLANARLKGLTGTTNPNNSQQGKLIGTSDDIIKNIRDISTPGLLNNDYINIDKAMKGVEIAEGAAKNPLGVASIGLLKAAINGAELYLTRGATISGGGATAGSNFGGFMGGSKALAIGGGAASLAAIAGIPGSSEAAAPNDWSGSAGVMPKVKSDIIKDPATPEGLTLGDLLDKNTDKLQELIVIQQKQLKVLQDTHDEYMDYLSDAATKTRINETRTRNQGNLSHAK